MRIIIDVLPLFNLFAFDGDIPEGRNIALLSDLLNIIIGEWLEESGNGEEQE